MFGASGVSFGKMYLFTMQSDLNMLKELKRIQLMLVGDERGSQ